MFAFVLAILVPSTILFTTGTACPNVVTMKMDDACLKSCNTMPEWYTLCQDTLRSEPDTAKVSSYALMATRLAIAKYGDAIIHTLDPMLGAGNMPKEEREAVSNCKSRYREAGALMESIAEQMVTCDFSRGRQEYGDVEASIGSCYDGLWPYQFLPLYDMVKADRDLTMVALELAGLIFSSY
ncbi:hypothetical protein HU200_028636 [Digitaria exilis]|uniref:Pectinesterase inhibitor domain-containing protein n=1 Tax=Digitaria exilis TaxID=1010633 RepID=A0A835C3H4_9POAL|nr:hypothetical protein HU200_028636 [Digitaria exilis]